MSKVSTPFACLLGFGWLMFIALYGVGISPDSAKYALYAFYMHFVHDYNVPPHWPPLYPFVINLLMYAEPFVIDAASLLSGFSMLLLLVAFTRIIQRYSERSIVNCLLLLAFFTHAKVLHLYEYAWSESLFSLFLITHIYFVMKHLRTGKFSFYVFASLFASFSALTRYPGYAVIASFFLYTVYIVRHTRDFRGWSTYLLSYSVSFIPSLLWVGRNYLIFGTLHGVRDPSEATISESITLIAKILLEDLDIVLLGLLLISLFRYLWMWREHTNGTRRTSVVFLSYLLSLFSLYILLMILVSLHAAVPALSRYFSPLYFTLYLFIGVSFTDFLRPSVHTAKKMIYASRSISLGIVFFLGASIVLNAKALGKTAAHIEKIPRTELSHLEPGFRKSTTAARLYEYFASVLPERESVHMFSFYRSDVPEFNDMFLSRKVFLRYPPVAYLRFKNVSKKSFQVAYEVSSRPQTLTYHFLPDNVTTAGVPSHIVRSLGKTGRGTLILILSKKTDQIGRTVSSLLRGRSPRISRKTIGDYVIFLYDF